MQSEASERRIQHLETQLQEQRHVAAASQAASSGLADAQQQIQALESRRVTADERVASTERQLAQLQAAFDAKAAEVQNLELAMGELTYEAESARTAQLQSRQLQVSLSLAS